MWAGPVSIALIAALAGAPAATEPPTAQTASEALRAIGERVDDATGDSFAYLGDGVTPPAWADLVAGGGYRVAADDPGLRALLDTVVLPLCSGTDVGAGAVCPASFDATAFEQGVAVFWGELAAPIEGAEGLLTYVSVAGSDGTSPGLDLGAMQPNSPFNGANVFYNFDLAAGTLQHLRYDGTSIDEPAGSAIVLPTADAVVLVVPAAEAALATWDVSVDLVAGVSAATTDALRPAGAERFELAVAALPSTAEPPTTTAPATDATVPGTTSASVATDTTAPTKTTSANEVDTTDGEAAAADTGSDDDDGGGFPWWIVLVVLALGAIAAVAVVVSRRRARPGGDGALPPPAPPGT